MKLGLGTVQFGMDYGISNQIGQSSAEEVVAILSTAQRNDIRVIDTAALYGTSETVLGKALSYGHQFKIVTKTIRFDSDRITLADASLLEEHFDRSLKNLQSTSVYGLLIHNVSDILAQGGSLLVDSLAVLKRRGLVSKIGVSIYTPEQIDQVLDRYEFDLVQLPLNILDQRLLRGGQLSRLKAVGVEIHARSAFLQGLLLMEPNSLPKIFDPIKTHLIRYREVIARWGITPVQAALGFVAGIDEIDSVICGVNNPKQLEELCSSIVPLQTSDFKDFAIRDDFILNPSNWLIN